jgi:hypothetical protein
VTSCTEQIDHLASVTPLADNTSIYISSCERGYTQVDEHRIHECRDETWIPSIECKEIAPEVSQSGTEHSATISTTTGRIIHPLLIISNAVE